MDTQQPVINTFIRCFTVGIFNTILMVLFNSGVSVAQDAVFAWSRDESTLADVALLLILVFIARRQPAVIKPITISAAVILLGIIGTTLCAFGVAAGEPFALVVGILLHSPLDTWGIVIWLLACSTLDTRRACICFAGSSCIGYVIAYLVGLVHSYLLEAVVSCICSIFVVLLCLAPVQQLFRRLLDVGAPIDQEIAQPQTFLPFSHTFYVFIFAFSMAFGFALRCEDTSNSLLSTIANFAAAGTVLIYALKRRENLKVDALFIASIALVIAGFMLVLPADTRTDTVAAPILIVGYMCFELLTWLALTAAASRNSASAIPTVCWGTATSYLGIVAGLLVWMAPNLFLEPFIKGDNLLQTILVIILIITLVIYALVTRRAFEFDATIAGIAPDAPAPHVEVCFIDSLANSCQQAAKKYNLTPREAEVMTLLAHGNKSSHIQQELTIGANTVKYHVKNIYAKLGVHSQQELIDLICQS